MMKKLHMQVIFAVLLLIALPAIAKADILKNNNYPYGKDATSTTIKLVAPPLQGIDSEQFVWQKSQYEVGPYEDIPGATGLEYKVTQEGGKTGPKYWYRVRYGETQNFSKHVQVLFNPCDAGSSLKQSLLYVSNGKIAYTVNGYYFDVGGYYEKSDPSTGSKTPYHIGTSYNGNWTIYADNSATYPRPQRASSNTVSNAGLKSLQFAFDENNPQIVNLTFQLEEGYRHLAIGADVMLGSSTVTTYADSAALSEIMNPDGTVGSVQMVGAMTVEKSKPEDPAFVIDFGTAPKNCWVGYYSSRMYFDNGPKTFCESTLQSETDSGMTASWGNVEDGIVKMTFSVGSVETTGAVTGKVSYPEGMIIELEPNTEYTMSYPDGDKEVKIKITSNGEGKVPLEGTATSASGGGVIPYNFYGHTVHIEHEKDSPLDIAVKSHADKPRDEDLPSQEEPNPHIYVVPEADGTETVAVHIKDDPQWEYSLDEKKWERPDTDGKAVIHNVDSKLVTVDVWVRRRATSADPSSQDAPVKVNVTFQPIFDRRLLGSVPQNNKPKENPSKEGCVFEGWFRDIRDKTTRLDDYEPGEPGQWYYANYLAYYTVNHHLQKDGGIYELKETEEKTGEIGDTVTAVPKTYYGYALREEVSGIVTELPSPKLVLNVYYDKITEAEYTVEHYIAEEGTPGVYKLHKSETKTGTIGKTVQGDPIAISCYAYDSTVEGTVSTGVVFLPDEEGGEGLVLKLYYNEVFVDTPDISPDGCSFDDSQLITITCATDGAQIYYTLDGTAPTTQSFLYNSAFSVDSTTTVTAFAVKTDMRDSAMDMETYTKNTFDATVTPIEKTFADAIQYHITPETATFTITNTDTGVLRNISIVLDVADKDSFVLDTTDTTTDELTPGASTSFTVSTKAGLEPKTYTGTVTVSNARLDTIQTILLSFTVNAKQTVAVPVITPVSGSYDDSQTVKIECATDGAVIHFTTDGTIPTEKSPVYNGEFTISGDGKTNVKAYAVKELMYPSEVASETYAKNIYSAMLTPSEIVFDDQLEGYGEQPVQLLTLTNTGTAVFDSVTVLIDSDAFELRFADVRQDERRMRLKASKPNNAHVLPPIETGASVTFAATPVVGLTAGTYNAIISATDPKLETPLLGEISFSVKMVDIVNPVITHESCSFVDTQMVSITCDTMGAVIHYTTDGSTPTNESPVYTVPFTVNTTTTVKAIAMKVSAVSEIVSETYTKLPPMRIVTQPEDQFVVEGQTADFSVSVSGGMLPYSYQWYINRGDNRGWMMMDGAVDYSYTTSITKLQNNGYKYRCIVSDAHGQKLESESAMLFVSKYVAPPQTGDSSKPLLWLGLTLAGLAGIVTFVLRGKKKAY